MVYSKRFLSLQSQLNFFMIDVKEIKIGNWFEHNDSWSYRNEETKLPFSFQWNETDWWALGECTLFIESVSPIPLTEEWLLKLGFKKQKASELYIEYDNDRFIVVNCLMGVHLGFDVEVYFEEEYEHIKYVHQLQNLYYTLTGKELK